jgi:hypothetical protein
MQKSYMEHAAKVKMISDKIRALEPEFKGLEAALAKRR